MRPRVLSALAMADFRERVRRPAYAMVLLVAVGLGYMAAPAADSHWTIVNSGAYRGIYNSAYIGTVTALAGALWLFVGGFYVVRTAIGRDERTGVGQLLAATTLRTPAYLIGKFLSNLLVLGSMAAALAATALVMQFARGESRAVDPAALLLPFALFTLPVLAVAATAAVLFETVPLLRTGIGNVVWFFVSLAVMIAGQSAGAPLGGLGVHVFAESMRDAMAAQGIAIDEFALGLMYLDDPPGTITWSGMDFTAGFIRDRVFIVLLAMVAAAVPTIWFGRFDRTRSAGPATPATAAPTAPPLAQPMVVSVQTMPRYGVAFGRLLVGEWRILTQGVSKWWWLGTAVLIVAGVAAPAPAAALTLLAAWVWPVLIWSRMGTQSAEHGVNVLLDAYQSPRRRVLAQWLAGVMLTALVGLGPGIRMALAGDLADWLAGATFIPALALTLGLLSRTQRLFQAAYLPLWYAVVNNIDSLDYMGVLVGGPSPTQVTAATTLLLAAALATVAARHAHR